MSTQSSPAAKCVMSSRYNTCPNAPMKRKMTSSTCNIGFMYSACKRVCIRDDSMLLFPLIDAVQNITMHQYDDFEDFKNQLCAELHLNSTDEFDLNALRALFDMNIRTTNTNTM